MDSFFDTFRTELERRVGDAWTVKRIVHRPGRDSVDLSGIDKRTILVLWGDERSRVFPSEHANAAGFVVKPYCPETWTERGVIPCTDSAMNWDGDGDSASLVPCSARRHAVFFSGNLNYRRTDLFRALAGRSFGWPFRIRACRPVTGYYPFYDRIEAAVLNRIVKRFCRQRDFSNLYPDSFVRFNDGFCKGSLSGPEYIARLRNSKIVWCTPGFMTNETSRLIEASCAGCVCVVGPLPDNALYRGNPFVRIDDWRNVRQVTEFLLRNPAEMDRIGASCRRWYLSHFSPSAQAARIAAEVKKRNRTI